MQENANDAQSGKTTQASFTKARTLTKVRTRFLESTIGCKRQPGI